jgi:hypothetical protein
MTNIEVPTATEVEDAARAWRRALATLSPDRSVAGRTTAHRAEGALTGCAATVRALSAGRS